MYNDQVQISHYLETQQVCHASASPPTSVISSPPPPSLSYIGLNHGGPNPLTGGVSAPLPPSSRGRKKSGAPLDPSKAVHCAECMKQFSHDFHLKIHMRCHTGERPFECTVCLKRFTQKGNLDTHMRKHTGDRPFKCEVCNKCFTQKGNMETHMRLHTGEKPFQCMLCQKRFYQQGGLKNHKCANDPGGGGVSNSTMRVSSERRGRRPVSASAAPSQDHVEITPMVVPKQEPSPVPPNIMVPPHHLADSHSTAALADRNWYHLEGRAVFSDMFIKREAGLGLGDERGYHPHQ